MSSSAGPIRSEMLERTQLAAAGTEDMGAGAAEAALREPPSRVGRFRIERRLGAGSMGAVFLAHDPDLDRRVAVKIIGLAQVPGSDHQERLLREAKAMARVQHPNVVTVHEAGILDSHVWIAMEYVKGTTLTAWSHAAHRSWRSVLDIMLAAGEGIAAVHAAGLVHRDIKPDNIMVGEDGRVKVMDFGLVREDAGLTELSRGRRGPAATLDETSAGLLIGTPRYMAPEQYQLQRADAQSDQYSWCVACWEAVYGVHPFPQATLGGLMLAITEGKVAAPPLGREVPNWLNEVLMRGMCVDPALRFASLEELFQAIADRRTSFAAAVASKNAAALRIEVWVGLFLVPFFWILDWVVLRSWVWVTLGMRLACVLAAGLVIGIASQAPRALVRHVTTLSFAYSQMVLCSIAVMCFLHDGYESPYYAGMNLMYLAVGQFFWWDLRRSVAFVVTGYCFYMAPMALGVIRVDDPVAVLLNQFFLLSTILITVVSQVHRFRQARVEFDERVVQERLLAQARAPRQGATRVPRAVSRGPRGSGRRVWPRRARRRPA